MNQRKVLPGQIVADDAVELGTEALCKLLRGRRELLRSHVVRRRIDEIAGKSRRFRHSRDGRNVDAVGRHQLDTRGIRLAIATEAITAERKRKRVKTGVVR